MKEEIRKQYKLIRKNVNNKNEKACLIAKEVAKIKEFRNSKLIAVYKSYSSETNTDEIIEFALKTGKIVAIPKTNGKELLFYKISSLKDTFEKNKFGIEEPIENKKNEVSKKDIELAIIPGICFDKYKNRLGYGGGYYDRFLKNSSIIKIGICFEEQIYNKVLPTDENDVKMDFIITDKNIY